MTDFLPYVGKCLYCVQKHKWWRFFSTIFFSLQLLLNNILLNKCGILWCIVVVCHTSHGDIMCILCAFPTTYWIYLKFANIWRKRCVFCYIMVLSVFKTFVIIWRLTFNIVYSLDPIKYHHFVYLVFEKLLEIHKNQSHRNELNHC